MQFILPLIAGSARVLEGTLVRREPIFFLTGGFMADELTIEPSPEGASASLSLRMRTKTAGRRTVHKFSGKWITSAEFADVRCKGGGEDACPQGEKDRKAESLLSSHILFRTRFH